MDPDAFHPDALQPEDFDPAGAGPTHQPGSRTSESPQPTDPDGPRRGHFRLADLERVAHGVYQPRGDEETVDEKAEFERTLRAWRLVLPPDAVFTHVTAARLLGWQLPKLPEHVPVFAAVAGDGRRPRRPGIICSRLQRRPPITKETIRYAVLPGDDWFSPTPDDLPVDWPEEILLRAARDLGVVDLVILMDSARRLGHVSGIRMRALLETGRPGVGLLREAWELSDARAESGPESLLRIFHHVIDVAVTPQAPLEDAHGNVFGRADLLVSGTPFVHEYDGAHHRQREQQAHDLRRERRLAERYVRRAWTLDELLNHPLTVSHEIDRALGRPHRPNAVARWHRLVENSQYGERGRGRTMNRWRRFMPLNDWAETA